MTFRLYPVAQSWWSMADYGAVLSVVERLQPQRVLEFGPGSSTLALIEGGARHIDACEDSPVWFDIYCERLAAYIPKSLRMVRYRWADQLAIANVDHLRYDLALIDGPRETPRRPVVIEYCLRRCTWVLVPLEEADGSPLLRGVVSALAEQYKRSIEFMQTGPLAGAFALIGPA